MLATALHYYYRFYLSRSILEYHPIVTLYTCLYLSGKTEENYLAVERMVEMHACHVLCVYHTMS